MGMFKIVDAATAAVDAVSTSIQKSAPAVTKALVVGADALAQGMVRLDGEIVYSNSRRLSKLLNSQKREKRMAAAVAASHVKEILDSLK